MPPMNVAARGAVRSRARRREGAPVPESESPAAAAASGPPHAELVATQSALRRRDGAPAGGLLVAPQPPPVPPAPAPARDAAKSAAPPAQWSCDEVCSWVSETLRKEGIDGEAAIVTAFRKQGIRGQHLSMLTSELLRNELEFGALGHRLSFLQARDKLLGTGPAGTDKGQDGSVKLMETIGSNVASLTQKLVALSARVEEMFSRPTSGRSRSALIMGRGASSAAHVRVVGGPAADAEASDSIADGSECDQDRLGVLMTHADVRRLVDEETAHLKAQTTQLAAKMAASEELRRELMKRAVIPWEDEDDGTRLPGQWVNVRVFISSSFIDTQAERDMLVQNVLPKLNHELAKNFVRVTFVDLRWGVSSHESASCEAIQRTCLNELERCVEISPISSHPCPSYPFFVCLRTKRKGWVMDAVNKPKVFEKPERFAWIEDTNLGVHEKKLSITELEIYHALLGRREDNQDFKRAFVYFRDDQEFINKVDAGMRWIFDFDHISEEDVQTRKIADSVKVQYAITPEAALRRRDYDQVDKLIRKRASDTSGPVLVRTYTPTSATTRITGQMPGANGKKFGVGHVIGLQDLERQIYIDLFEAINAQYPKPHRQLNAMALEDMYHQNHITSSKACFGRDDLLSTLMDLVARGGVRCPVAVVGLPGSGKTTVMSAFIKCLVEQRGKEKDLVVFFHVVASSPQSFSIKNLLTRLCEFLKKRCDLSLEVPTTMAALRDRFSLNSCSFSFLFLLLCSCLLLPPCMPTCKEHTLGLELKRGKEHTLGLELKR